MTPPLDRPTAVLLLLDSLLDYLPTVKSATGQLAASGGSAVGTVKTCPRCDGSGVEIVERWDDGHRRQVACGECRGERTVEAKRGESGSDPMIDRSAKGLSAIKGRGMERSELDAEIASLERTRRDRAGERSSRDAYGWERERSKQWRAGSYHELAGYLDSMQRIAPQRFYRVWRYVCHLHIDGWSPEVRESFRESIDWVAAVMPTRIRVPHEIENRAEDLQDQIDGKAPRKPLNLSRAKAEVASAVSGGASILNVTSDLDPAIGNVRIGQFARMVARQTGTSERQVRRLMMVRKGEIVAGTPTGMRP